MVSNLLEISALNTISCICPLDVAYNLPSKETINLLSPGYVISLISEELLIIIASFDSLFESLFSIKLFSKSNL